MVRQPNTGEALKRPAHKPALNLASRETVEERLAILEHRLDEVIQSLDTWSGRFAIAIAGLERKIRESAKQSASEP